MESYDIVGYPLSQYTPSIKNIELKGFLSGPKILIPIIFIESSVDNVVSKIRATRPNPNRSLYVKLRSYLSVIILLNNLWSV